MYLLQLLPSILVCAYQVINDCRYFLCIITQLRISVYCTVHIVLNKMLPHCPQNATISEIANENFLHLILIKIGTEVQH